MEKEMHSKHNLERNHGRLVVLRPETPGSELMQRNVIRTEEEHRKLGAAVAATVEAARAQPNPEAEIARLAALDAATEPFDFEK